MKYTFYFLLVLLVSTISINAQTYTVDEVKEMVLKTKHKIEAEANEKITKRDKAITALQQRLDTCKEQLKVAGAINEKTEEKCSTYYKIVENRKKLSQLCEEQLRLSQDNTRICSENETMLKKKLLDTQKKYEEAAAELDKPFYEKLEVWISVAVGLVFGIFLPI